MQCILIFGESVRKILDSLGPIADTKEDLQKKKYVVKKFFCLKLSQTKKPRYIFLLLINTGYDGKTGQNFYF